MLSFDFRINEFYKCVYSKFEHGKGVIICIYVNGMLIFGADLEEVEKIKCFLSSKFSMKDMREADVILGVKIIRNNDGISLSQSHYIEKLLGRFNYKDCSQWPLLSIQPIS